MLEVLDKNFKLISIIVIGVLILLMMRQCQINKELEIDNDKLSQENRIVRGNLRVMSDTVRFWKDQNGRALSSISILTANSEMLKTQFADVYKKYLDLAGKSADNSRMIAYLNGQVSFKDREISDLRTTIAGIGRGSQILNDSTVLVDVGKTYDSLNSYRVSGTIQTSIKDNKIKAGKVDLTTSVDMGIEIALDRDKKTDIAKITTRTPFPAKITVKGLTQIENEINRKPSAYLGISAFAGYGATLQKQPTLTPFLGLGVYYAPSWLTIKLYKK